MLISFVRGIVTSSSSSSSSSYVTSSSYGTSSSYSGTPASAVASKSAATGKAQFGYGEVVGAAVALIGAVVGGGLVF